MRRLVIVILATLLGLAGPQPAFAAGSRGQLPIHGSLVRGFDPPDAPWGAGHRGVDLAADAGTIVHAPAAGVVTFAAVLAGRPVLVVDHGDVRSTFEPVAPLVPVGTRVSKGDPIGRLLAGHACPASVCLHWGLKRGAAYLNPLSLLGREILLLSDADAAAIARRG